MQTQPEYVTERGSLGRWQKITHVPVTPKLAELFVGVYRWSNYITFKHDSVTEKILLSEMRKIIDTIVVKKIRKGQRYGLSTYATALLHDGRIALYDWHNIMQEFKILPYSYFMGQNIIDFERLYYYTVCFTNEYAFLINTTSSNCIKRIQCGRATRVVAIRDHAFFVANSNFYSCSQTDIQLTEPDVVDFTCSNRVCLLLKTNGDVVTIRGRNRHGRTVHKWFIYPLRKSRLEFANPFPNYHIKQIQNFERGLMLITQDGKLYYASKINVPPIANELQKYNFLLLPTPYPSKRWVFGLCGIKEALDTGKDLKIIRHGFHDLEIIT